MIRPMSRKDRERHWARRREPHFFAGLLILALSLWVLGFANFMLANASRQSALPSATARLGIVVLTGGTDRLQWGMNALSEGLGQRLFISGVNEVTTRGEIRNLISDPDDLFECCVELDYAAHNTVANAAEAVRWAEGHGFDGLLIVTSYYHMPRTLLEFRTRAPELTVYPLAVEPEGYDANNWWYPNTFRILAWEYTKYELALMRIRLENLF